MNPLLTKISFLINAVAAVIYLSQLIFNRRFLLVIAKRIVLVAFVLQGVNFGIYLSKVGYPFLLESADAYLFSAWVLTALFLVLSWKYRFELVGVLFLPAILILYTFSHFSKESYRGITGLLYSPWASVHIVFGFLSFAIFFLSFIMGVLFLFQEFQLKRKKISRVFDRLPSLDILDQLHYKALTVGFVLLTLGIISGSAWAKSVKNVYFFDDPRQLWSIIAWLLYAFFFQIRFSAGWRGRKGILLSLIGFMVILFTFLEVRHS